MKCAAHKINHLRVTLKCEKVSLDLLCGSVEICKYANKSLPHLFTSLPLNLAAWKCESVEVLKSAYMQMSLLEACMNKTRFIQAYLFL